MKPSSSTTGIVVLALICGCSHAPSPPIPPATRPGSAQETTSASPVSAAGDRGGARPDDRSDRIALEREQLLSRGMDAERQLAAAESELKRAREAITLMEDKLRVQEVVLQGLKAEAEKAPPVKPGVSSEVRRLSSQLSRTEGKRYAAETALKKAKTTIASLEGRLSVKNALLLESKVDLDKATRAMIDNMYRRALSGETAAEVAQSRIRMLKNQLTETEEVLARARQVIAKLRAERPVEAPRGD